MVASDREWRYLGQIPTRVMLNTEHPASTCTLPNAAEGRLESVPSTSGYRVETRRDGFTASAIALTSSRHHVERQPSEALNLHARPSVSPPISLDGRLAGVRTTRSSPVTVHSLAR